MIASASEVSALISAKMMSLSGTLATSIPSPPNPFALELGPITVRWYAVWIIVGMALAIWWSGRRWVKRGGEPELVFDVGLAVCVMGIIGARAMAVISYPEQYFGSNIPWYQIFLINQGGLAIFGGLILGLLTVMVMLKRKKLSVLVFLDAVAPTVLVAQALGRMGNYFNQEVYGSPTDLPWGLEIADAFLPAGVAAGTLFHPTFLYEILWNLLGCGLILLYEHRGKFYAGELIALFFIWYSFGRFWLEFLRIDFQNTVLGGIRWFQLVAIVVFLLAVLSWLLLRKRRQHWKLPQEDS